MHARPQAVAILSVSHSALPNLFEKSSLPTGREQKRSRSPRMMAGGESAPAGRGVLAALAVLWVAAHVVPLLAVHPAGAAETAMDTARVLDVPPEALPEGQKLQWAALAVTALSILPTPGMLGIGDRSEGDGDE